MTVKEAREAARQWMVDHASGIPGFCGGYTAGSTNWLPEDAALTKVTDLDVMVVLSGQNQHDRRSKFIYRDTLLEITYLNADQLNSPEQILSDYHLAPSFRTTKVLFDPLGHLVPLLGAVARDYNKQRWVHQRCLHARDRTLGHLRSIGEHATFHDRVIACLFAAGITTHILLLAGLRNPTVRTRYAAVRELLADYRCLAFHEILLGLLGSVEIDRQPANHHLATLTKIFDAAQSAIKTPFPFLSDISEISRPISIDGSLELIGRGFHREAMFWIAVTHSRCRKVLSHDAPKNLTQSFNDSYQALTRDLGIPTLAEIRRRCEEIEQMLPRVCDVAESIIAANCEIEQD